MLVPAIVGSRGSYASIERHDLVGFDGSAVGQVSMTPPLLANEAVRSTSPTLRDMPIRDVLDVFADAGRRFATGTTDGLSADEYVRAGR